MSSLIASAFSIVLMMFLFLTPVGQCILLVSPFWPVAWSIIFFVVEDDYSASVVAITVVVVLGLYALLIFKIWKVVTFSNGRNSCDSLPSCGNNNAQSSGIVLHKISFINKDFNEYFVIRRSHNF